VIEVYHAAQRAVARARRHGHPTLLEVRTYRFMGHSMSDPTHGVYRTKEEVEEERRRDPIVRLAAQLQAEGVLDQPGYDALDAEATADADAALRFAEESPDPDPGQLTAHVLAD
jgi:pyruvate dehydrogenase E1 component alpha subunit